MTNKILVRLVLVSTIMATLTLAAWLAKPSALHLATRAETAEMSVAKMADTKTSRTKILFVITLLVVTP